MREAEYGFPRTLALGNSVNSVGRLPKDGRRGYLDHWEGRRTAARAYTLYSYQHGGTDLPEACEDAPERSPSGRIRETPTTWSGSPIAEDAKNAAQSHEEAPERAAGRTLSTRKKRKCRPYLHSTPIGIVAQTF
jgi:hypothetical protein